MIDQIVYELTVRLEVRGFWMNNPPDFPEGWYIEEDEHLGGNVTRRMYGPIPEGDVEAVKRDLLRMAKLRVGAVRRDLDKMFNPVSAEQSPAQAESEV